MAKKFQKLLEVSKMLWSDVSYALVLVKFRNFEISAPFGTISFQAVFASEIDNYAGGLWTPFSQLVITHQGYIIICKNAKNL